MGSSIQLSECTTATNNHIHLLREAKNAVGLLSQRNFDPNTRTLRRLNASEINDTVEKNIEGMVEDILEADKQRQDAELVGPS